MHIHIHIHIYTYTHIHIYTYVRISGWVSGGSRVVLGWFSGGYSRTKHVQSQEIIMPEASTKKRVWKQGPILHEMMFRLHETTVSTSASKLSKITKWVSKAGLLGSFLFLGSIIHLIGVFDGIVVGHLFLDVQLLLRLRRIFFVCI